MLGRIQGWLQWCFVKVEALFNLAFGEKLNPLYYIGPISYYLMWLIVASGLYLYAFFETSVTGASASVAKALRCTSMPGEVCSAGVSTSAKPPVSNQPRSARWMRLRLPRNGSRRSSWSGRHGGIVDGLVIGAILDGPVAEIDNRAARRP